MGILAYNEAAAIEGVLTDLAAQSLFDRPDLDVSVHVVANGCHDDTASVARGLLAEGELATRIEASTVYDIEQRGKPNAWNQLIHEYLEPATDVVLMLDADIRLPDHSLCAAAVDALRAHPEARVAVDRPVSDLDQRKDLTMIERLVRAATATEHDPLTSVTGHFYCAQADFMRSIRLPDAIVGEDGFIRAMLLTDGFTADENFARIAAVSSHHVFESEATIRGTLHHQVRQTLGTVLNISLFSFIRSNPDLDVAADFDRRNHDDPTWLVQLAAEWWPSKVPDGARRRLLTRRFRHGDVQLRQWPMRAAATLVDVCTYGLAMRKLRNGSAVGFW